MMLNLGLICYTALFVQELTNTWKKTQFFLIWRSWFMKFSISPSLRLDSFLHRLPQYIWHLCFNECVGHHFFQTSKDLLGCKLALPPSALNPVSWESVSPLINPPLPHLTFCPFVQHWLGHAATSGYNLFLPWPGPALSWLDYIATSTFISADSQEGRWGL